MAYNTHIFKIKLQTRFFEFTYVAYLLVLRCRQCSPRNIKEFVVNSPKDGTHRIVYLRYKLIPATPNAAFRVIDSFVTWLFGKRQ